MTLAAVVLALATLLPQDGGRSVGAEERDALFALLDRFDSLDTSKLPLVRVATGLGMRYGNEPPQNTYRHGFLLAAKGKEFRVRYLELDTEVLTSTPAGTPEHLRVGFEPLDLRTFASELVAGLPRSGDLLSREHHYRRRDTPMEPFTVALLAARACMRCGHETECDLLLRVAAKEQRGGSLATDWRLQSDLRSHLVLAFAEPSVSWDDLLAKHDAWLEHFTEDEKYRPVSNRRPALVRVVDGRRARPPRSQPPTDAELIEDLRDHLMARDSGGFDDWPVGPARPAPEHAVRAMDLLVQRGVAAVPALIAALDDETPTRSTSYCSRYGGHFDIRSLGDVAEDVLAAIAGERVQDWRAWLDKATRAGLRECVRAALRTGHREAVAAWTRRWPDDVEPVFESAKALAGWPRYTMLDTAARSGSPAARARALQELRADAARDDELRGWKCALLMQHGDVSGYRSLLDDWRAGRLPMDVLADQLSAILGAGIQEARPLLLEGLDRDDVRGALVAALATSARDQFRWHVPAADRAGLERDLRTCMVRLLRDETLFGEGVALVSGRERVQLHRASRADVAAAMLSSWWPGEFPFDPAATARVRARLVASLRAKADGASSPAPGRLTKVDASTPNLVTSVSFAPSAAALPASAKDSLAALHGTSPDASVLVEKLFEVARTDACAGKSIVLHFARDGDGTGATVHCELVERASDWDFLATVGGVATFGGCSWGKWDRDTAMPEILGGELESVRRALRSPAACGVEMLLAVRAP